MDDGRGELDLDATADEGLDETGPRSGQLLGDLPLEDPDLDRLGYRPFAEAVADTIARTPSPSGLALALHGKWGVGKSSVLNFIKRHLSTVAADEIEVVSFNPWWFTGPNEVATGLIHLITDTAWPQRSKRQKKARKAVGTLALVGSGASAAIPGGSLGGAALTAVADKLLGPKDVASARDALIEALKERDKRTLVIIDDVDRLLPAEMAQMFGVIKGFMSLPGVIYLMAYDPDVVHSSLGLHLGITNPEDAVATGKSYMEKIAQGRFDLPKPYSTALAAVLEKETRDLAASLGMEIEHGSWRLRNVLLGARSLLATPRDVVLIMNGMRTTLPSVAPELNIVDYLGLEIIRYFDPQLHDDMHHNAGMFRTTENSDYSQLGLGESNGDFHKVWLARAEKHSEAHGLGLATIVTTLFPSCDRDISRTSSARNRPTAVPVKRHERGVSHPSLHERYFRLYANPSEFTRDELQHARNLLRVPNVFARHLVDLNKERPLGHQSRAELLLAEMQDLRSQLTAAEEANLFRGLLIAGEDLFREAFDGGVNGSDASSEVRFMTMDIAERLSGGWGLVTETVGADAPLYMSYRFINGYVNRVRHRGWGELQHAAERYGADDASSGFKLGDLLTLRSLVADRLVASLKDGSIHDLPSRVGPVFAIATWHPEGKRQISEHVRDRRIADAFFKSLIDKSSDDPRVWMEAVDSILGDPSVFYATISKLYEDDPDHAAVRDRLLADVAQGSSSRDE